MAKVHVKDGKQTLCGRNCNEVTIATDAKDTITCKKCLKALEGGTFLAQNPTTSKMQSATEAAVMDLMTEEVSEGPYKEANVAISSASAVIGELQKAWNEGNLAEVKKALWNLEVKTSIVKRAVKNQLWAALK